MNITPEFFFHRENKCNFVLGEMLDLLNGTQTSYLSPLRLAPITCDKAEVTGV